MHILILNAYICSTLLVFRYLHIDELKTNRQTKSNFSNVFTSLQFRDCCWNKLFQFTYFFLIEINLNELFIISFMNGGVAPKPLIFAALFSHFILSVYIPSVIHRSGQAYFRREYTYYFESREHLDCLNNPKIPPIHVHMRQSFFHFHFLHSVWHFGVLYSDRSIMLLSKQIFLCNTSFFLSSA